MSTTPTPAPALQSAFWTSLGEHAAVIALQVGEDVALAFLSGFLSKKLGTPLNISMPPVA